MMRFSAYNRFGVLMGTSSRASGPRWLSLRGDSLPMITLISSQGDFCATATQGSGITLTQLDSTTYHPGFAVLPASERAAILWKLRPYGELRHFFYSSPCCFEARFGIQG